MTQEAIKPGTPLPWAIVRDCVYGLNCAGTNRFSLLQNGGFSDDGTPTSDAEKSANAAYIVHACNLYPDLLEALEKWLAYDNLDEADFTQVGPMLLYAEAINTTRAAIAKARGQ